MGFNSRICITSSDMSGDTRNEVKKIVNMERGTCLQIPRLYTRSTRDLVPVIVAFTKFDAYIFVKGIEAQNHESGRIRAYADYEEKLRSSLCNDKVLTAIIHGSLPSFLWLEWTLTSLFNMQWVHDWVIV